MDIIEQFVEQCERRSQTKLLKKAKKKFDEYDVFHHKNKSTFEDHLYYVVKTELLHWANLGER